METRFLVLIAMFAMFPMRGDGQYLQRVSEMLSRSGSYVAKHKALLIGSAVPVASLAAVTLYAQKRQMPIKQVLPAWWRTLVLAARHSFVRGIRATNWFMGKIAGFFPRRRREEQPRGVARDQAVGEHHRHAGALPERREERDRDVQPPHPVIGDFHEEVPCDCGYGRLKVAVTPGNIHQVALGGNV